MNAYEGMFIIDSTEVRKDTSEPEEKIRGLLQKTGGELAGMARWDERKLAYGIKGRDAGLYILAYFRGGPDVVRKLSRECQLSTYVLRSLFLRVAEIPDIESVTVARKARRDLEQEEEERFGDGRGPRGGGGTRIGPGRGAAEQPPAGEAQGPAA